jgi:Domain of unknown function (DUF4258)
MALIFTTHALRRMRLHRILVREALRAPVLVEDYPEDGSYPSRLILGWVSNRPIHLVVTDQPVEGHTIVVTVYEPDPEQWEPGFQRRRPVR